MAFVEEVPVASSWVSHPYLGGDAVKAASKAALVLAGDELRLSYFDLSAFRWANPLSEAGRHLDLHSRRRPLVAAVRQPSLCCGPG